VANYFVVLESIVPSQNRAVESIFESLKTPVQRLLNNTWLVTSPLGRHELYEIFSPVALPGDRFLIIEAIGCVFDNLLISADALDATWDAIKR
jgi:hypothetical protein